MIGMSLLSMLAVVLSGLVSAVSSSRNYTAGLEEANIQSQAALDRIKYIASHAGVYQTTGQETVPGFAVVTHNRNGQTIPDTLVIWSGGRSGGLATQGPLDRLPVVNELLIYTPNPNNPAQLVELVVSTNSNTIDFKSQSFDTTIRSLITRDDAEMLRVMDRLRVTNLANDGSTSGNTGCVWFELSQTPNDAAIASATVGTESWMALPWVQGIAAGSNGLRQVTINIELQANTDYHNKIDSTDTQPFLGALSYRYVYQP